MRIVLVLALALSTTGCPLGDDDGDPANYVAIDQIPAAYKDAYCTYLASCGVFPDKAACLGAEISIAYHIDPNIAYAAATGALIYNGSNVKACFDALAQRSCDRTSQSARTTTTACRDFVRGTLASGERCTIDHECISQRCAGGSTTTTCSMGTCVGDTPPDLRPAQIGERCTTVPGCADGLYCDTFDDTCTTLKTGGMACTVSSECGYGLGCIGATGERTCEPLPGEGQPCPDFMCRDDGMYCDSTTGTCAKVGLPPSTCTSSSQCSQYYPCNFTTGQCTQGPGLGQPCSASSRCFAAGTYCDSATLMCESLKADGAPCSSSTECASVQCDFATGRCESPATCF